MKKFIVIIIIVVALSSCMKSSDRIIEFYQNGIISDFRMMPRNYNIYLIKVNEKWYVIDMNDWFALSKQLPKNDAVKHGIDDGYILPIPE